MILETEGQHLLDWHPALSVECLESVVSKEVDGLLAQRFFQQTEIPFEHQLEGLREVPQQPFTGVTGQVWRHDLRHFARDQLLDDATNVLVDVLG